MLDTSAVREPGGDVHRLSCNTAYLLHCRLQRNPSLAFPDSHRDQKAKTCRCDLRVHAMMCVPRSMLHDGSCNHEEFNSVQLYDHMLQVRSAARSGSTGSIATNTSTATSLCLKHPPMTNVSGSIKLPITQLPRSNATKRTLLQSCEVHALMSRPTHLRDAAQRKPNCKALHALSALGAPNTRFKFRAPNIVSAAQACERAKHIGCACMRCVRLELHTKALQRLAKSFINDAQGAHQMRAQRSSPCC